MSGRDIDIATTDGLRLAATVVEPSAPAVGWVVLSSATAVARRYYRHFAEYLAQHGHGVVTYDYRGIGGSRPSSLVGFEARFSDWGLLDMPAVIEWTRREFGAERVSLVGHSAGGQLAGLLETPRVVRAMVTLSSQSGYWRHQGRWQKAGVALHAYVTMPALARAFGYLPWSRFGGAEDLPKGVALEWARWCRSPGYLLDDRALPLRRYRSFEAPVLAYSIDDDDWGTAAAVDAMMKAYPNVERRHIVPRERGLGRLGHFGVFRPPGRPIWEEIRGWLDARSVAP